MRLDDQSETWFKTFCMLIISQFETLVSAKANMTRCTEGLADGPVCESPLCFWSVQVLKCLHVCMCMPVEAFSNRLAITSSLKYFSASMLLILQQNRLRWYGHVLRKDDDWVKKCMEYEVEGPRPRRSPKRTWREVVREDCQARKLNRGCNG